MIPAHRRVNFRARRPNAPAPALLQSRYPTPIYGSNKNRRYARPFLTGRKTPLLLALTETEC
jgi:hypothetical protein